MNGPNAQISSEVVQNGGIKYDPIPGDLLRTFEETPQVEVIINDIPSKCIGNCYFDWLDETTPTVSFVDKDNGKYLFDISKQFLYEHPNFCYDFLSRF